MLWRPYGSVQLGGWRICWSKDAPQPLHTLSLARNWLTGTTDSINGANSLQTLLLSGNQLECDAVRLDNATNLGQGQFSDPAKQVLSKLGTDVATSTPFINPFGKIETDNYTAIVMALSGNPFMTVGTSLLSSGSTGRLIKQDRIIRGRLQLFSGIPVHHLPMQLALHVRCVLHLDIQ